VIRRVLRRFATLDVAIFAVAIAILTSLELAHQQPPPPGPPVDSYSSYDAASGGYRALYELLAREGVRVERFERQPGFLDPGITTLVYSEPQTDPSTQNDARDLEAWVRAGGTLVYFGYDKEAAKAKILAQPYARDESKKTHRVALADTLQAAGVVSLGRVAGDLRWQQPAKRVRVLFDDGRGPVAIAYRFGKGTVVETIDETFLDNAQLATGDRARFAMALVTLVHPSSAVWFDEAIHDHLAPLHWYSIVPRAFIYALIGATIVMLVAIAGAAVRLGPPIPPPTADDRTSADFIDALSTLFERGKASGKALDDAVRSTTRAVARSVGLTGDPSGAEIAARIPDEERRRAFETMLAGATGTAPDPKRFLRTIALAQRLRKDSVSHGR
jgi:hypothetical protein